MVSGNSSDGCCGSRILKVEVMLLPRAVVSEGLVKPRRGALQLTHTHGCWWEVSVPHRTGISKRLLKIRLLPEQVITERERQTDMKKDRGMETGNQEGSHSAYLPSNVRNITPSLLPGSFSCWCSVEVLYTRVCLPGDGVFGSHHGASFHR